MNLIKYFILALAGALALTACSDEKEGNQISVMVSGIDNGHTVVEAGHILDISLYAETTASSFTNLRIESFNAKSGNTVLLDSVISGNIYNNRFYFKAPELGAETIDNRLAFKFTDVTGFTRTVERTIRIAGRNKPLEERSGVILYCSTNGDSQPDAYCFSQMRPIIAALVDSALIDLYIPEVGSLELPDPQNPPAVVTEWRTNTDLNFARSNSFDFGGATSANIEAAYESSTRAPRITNLRSGDIVLVGRDSQPLAAIQIVELFATDNINSSRYHLNIKAIKSAVNAQ